MSALGASALGDFVDLARYPIDDLEGRGAGLLADCRASLETTALCSLPDFLKPEAIALLQSEVAAVAHQAHFNDVPRPAYNWRAHETGFAPDHPIMARNRQSLGSIARPSFAEDGPLMSLYKQDGLTDFVGRALGHDRFYRIECPYLSMNVKVMGAGDELAWHFDQNDGVVSLLIQSAGAGGDFEYCPYIRAEDDENFDAVARLFKGEETLIQRPGAAAGTFSLFKGRRSIHRVTPITNGDPPRLIALFSYDRQPGLNYPEATRKAVLGENYASVGAG